MGYCCVGEQLARAKADIAHRRLQRAYRGCDIDRRSCTQRHLRKMEVARAGRRKDGFHWPALYLDDEVFAVAAELWVMERVTTVFRPPYSLERGQFPGKAGGPDRITIETARNGFVVH